MGRREVGRNIVDVPVTVSADFFNQVHTYLFWFGSWYVPGLSVVEYQPHSTISSMFSAQSKKKNPLNEQT